MEETHMAIIIASGVPGVGKTTCLERVRSSRPIVNFGTLLLDVAVRRGLVRSRDELRELPPDQRRALRREAVSQLSPDCILDVHLSVRTRSGLEPSLPAEIAELPVAAVLLFEGDPSAILARRRLRTGRQDPSDSEASIAEQQALNRTLAANVCGRTGAMLRTIETTRSIGAVVKEMADFLGTVSR